MFGTQSSLKSIMDPRVKVILKGMHFKSKLFSPERTNSEYRRKPEGISLWLLCAYKWKIV